MIGCCSWRKDVSQVKADVIFVMDVKARWSREIRQSGLVIVGVSARHQSTVRRPVTWRIAWCEDQEQLTNQQRRSVNVSLMASIPAHLTSQTIMILPHRPNSIPIPIRMPESATRLIPKAILQIPQNPSLSPPIRSIIFSKRCISTAFSRRFLRLSLSGVLFAVGGRNECLRSRYRWCRRDILVVNVLHPIEGEIMQSSTRHSTSVHSIRTELTILPYGSPEARFLCITGAGIWITLPNISLVLFIDAAVCCGWRIRFSFVVVGPRRCLRLSWWGWSKKKRSKTSVLKSEPQNLSPCRNSPWASYTLSLVLFADLTDLDFVGKPYRGHFRD